ncbi:MAG: hypothetical protein HY832_01320 [Candidatus Aenigmarchaeota archaeon]|nr:hypothetical protein [Candidatus Aenigmarchaeota archaeon]
MKKGVDPLVGAVLLVVIAVSIGSILLSFSTGLAKKESSTLKGTFSTQLACQYAAYYIKNATVDCNSSCAAGIPHTITITAINSGKKSLNITTMYLINTTGSLFSLELNESKDLNVGEVLTVSNVTTDACTSYNSSTRLDQIEIRNRLCSNTVAVLDGSDVSFVNC